MIAIGAFLNTLVNCLIIALAIFLVMRVVTRVGARLQRNQEGVTPAAPPAPPAEVQLLSEIRDLLKAQRSPNRSLTRPPRRVEAALASPHLQRPNLHRREVPEPFTHPHLRHRDGAVTSRPTPEQIFRNVRTGAEPCCSGFRFYISPRLKAGRDLRAGHHAVIASPHSCNRDSRTENDACVSATLGVAGFDERAGADSMKSSFARPST